MDHDAIGAQVQTVGSLRLAGVTRAQSAMAVRGGGLVVLHRGNYVEEPTWRSWRPEERELARTIAVMRGLRGADVAASHTSALVAHDLPLLRYRPLRAHVTGPTCDGSTRGAVARHRGAIEGDVVEVDGLAVTSLGRTVADVIGRLPLPAAVAVADAALRLVAWRRWRAEPYDEGDAEALRTEVRGHPALRPGARGSVQARWVIDFADGRAQRPGESATRLLLHRLGFAAPRLQVEVAVGRRVYELDFSLDDVETWLEFDGLVKYTDPALLAGRTAAEAVLAEKRREDDIRGATRRAFVRIEWPHIADAESLRRRLAELGVRAPGAPGAQPPGIRARVL